MSRPKVVITVHDVYKDLDHQEVLRGVNLEVRAGETLVILGPSGVGKSVLLKHLLGLMTPDRGWIEIEGSKLSTLDEDSLYKVLRRMGMLFQGAALFDSMSVEENVAFYLREHGCLADGTPIDEAACEEHVAEALSLVGLSNARKKMPSDLSGGMRKRAGLARLLAYRPLITLYDEPTTGLDPITAEQINDLILEIQEHLKATSVVVTHDILSAWRVGDRFALMADGAITHIDTPESFLKLEEPFVAFLRDHVISGLQPRERPHHG